MNRRPTFLIAPLFAAAALAGCGSSGPSISADQAKTAVQSATGVKLTAMDLPADAKGQGVNGAFSNQATAANDKQVVFVFALKDKDTVKKLRAELTSFSPSKKLKVISDDNVTVIYATLSADHAADIRTALGKLGS